MRDLGVSESDEYFIIPPFELLKVEYFAARREWLCVRVDKFGALRVFIYRATRWLDWFYRRSIIVLAVYGAADFHDGYIPSWRDIHILKRLVKP